MMIGIVAAALFLAQPAVAASDAACMLDQITSEQRAAIGQASYSGGESSPVDAAVDAAVRSCTERLGWDAGRARAAIPLALGTIIRDDARSVLARRGLSMDAVDRWFAAQSLEVRTTANPSDADLQRMMDALTQAGVAAAVLEANAEIVGGYLGARIMIERVERGLPFD